MVHTDAVKGKGEKAEQACPGAAFGPVLAGDSIGLPGKVELQAGAVFAFAIWGKVPHEPSGQPSLSTRHDLLTECFQLQKQQGLQMDPAKESQGIDGKKAWNSRWGWWLLFLSPPHFL